jgi:hypothetical protein
MPRNPRRAYEKDGREIPPMRENGPRSVAATCIECQHAATMNVDHLDGSIPVPDVALALRLRCSSCGARADGIYVRPNWSERKAGPGRLTGARPMGRPRGRASKSNVLRLRRERQGALSYPNWANPTGAAISI